MHDFLWLEQFHFIRPLWLFLIPLIIGIHWWYRRIYIKNDAWKKIIAPHLLSHLSVSTGENIKVRPYQLLTLLLSLTVIVVAGPTWNKQITPFTEDRAPLVIALKLTPSMLAVDQPPTRLERAKQKIKDLLARRQGARTALLVYAGSAHMALPLTEDVQLLSLYLDSLYPSLMPADGDQIQSVLTLATPMLVKQSVPGTLLVITDGIDSSAQVDFEQFKQQTNAQVLIYSVGSDRGGLLKDEQGRMMDTHVSGVDFGVMKSFANGIDGVFIRATLDEVDIDRLVSAVHSHLVDALDDDANLRWQDSGYPLVWGIAVIGLIWFRKGWALL